MTSAYKYPYFCFCILDRYDVVGSWKISWLLVYINIISFHGEFSPLRCLCSVRDVSNFQHFYKKTPMNFCETQKELFVGVKFSLMIFDWSIFLDFSFQYIYIVV